MTRQRVFEKIYFDHYDAVYLYVRRRVSSRSAAEDVVSETFLTAWAKLDSLQSHETALYWLYRIAYNHLSWSFRKASSRKKLLDKFKSNRTNMISHSPEDLVVGYEATLKALAKLSKADQELLRLIAWEGLTVAELSQVLECSENTIYTKIHRARARLKGKTETSMQDSIPEDHLSSRKSITEREVW